MKTMKKFAKYFIFFIVLYLLVTGLIYLGTMKNKNSSNNIECFAQTESPVIEVTECKNSGNKGKITGTITNDTNILINVIYVKAEFYDENGKLLGDEYSKIKYFNVGEKAKFEIEFSYKNVAKIKLTSTENVEADSTSA